MCASCLFANHFLVLFLFFACRVHCKPHFVALLQPAVPGAEPESPSDFYATEFSFFFDLKFILFRLFLILYFAAHVNIALNLFLTFEQK